MLVLAFVLVLVLVSVLVLAHTKFLDRNFPTLAFVSKTKMNKTVFNIAKKCGYYYSLKLSKFKLYLQQLILTSTHRIHCGVIFYVSCQKRWVTYRKFRGHCGSRTVSVQIIHNGMTDSTCILAKDDVIQSTQGKRAKKYVYITYAPVEVFPYESTFSKSGIFLRNKQVKSSQIH